MTQNSELHDERAPGAYTREGLPFALAVTRQRRFGHYVIAVGPDDGTGREPEMYVDPWQARELAALLIKTADEADEGNRNHDGLRRLQDRQTTRPSSMVAGEKKAA